MFEFANQLVLKVTKGCNLRCEYCYVKDKDENEGIFIDFDLYKKVIDKVIEDKLKSTAPNNTFHITFHGGEPTTLDKTVFYKMCEYAQQRFNEVGLASNFSIQTNLTLVDDEWCRLFSKFNVNVGASWDGVGEGNRARTDKSTESYLAKSALLTKYNILHGFLLVMNKQSLPFYEKSVEFLLKKFGPTTKANYVEDVFTPLGEKSPIEISGRDFFDIVLKKEIDYYIKHGSTRESNSSDIINKFMIDYLTNTSNYHSHRGNCYIKYCGSGINIIELNPDGTVQLCGRYGDSKDEATVLGNVLESDFLSVKQITKHLEFTKAKISAMEKSHCDNCLAQSICDHGCMAFYFSKTGKWGMRNDITCAIFKPAYNYLLEHASGIFEAFFKEKLQKPDDVYYMTLPSPKIAYFDIYRGKIKPLLKKYKVDISNDESNLIFTKRGDKNVKHNSNPQMQ
jgi:radical SAM protein with 4Fe4S-binding SPASM domain